MIDKMESLLLAIGFCHTFAMRKVTVGEVARALRKPNTTVYRHMLKAQKLGLIKSVTFNRGKMLCYEFSLTKEGLDFLDSFSLPF